MTIFKMKYYEHLWICFFLSTQCRKRPFVFLRMALVSCMAENK